MMGFSSAPFSLQGNGRHSPRVEPLNQGDRLSEAEENRGSRYSQGLGEQARPRAHSRFIHVKQEYHDRGPPDLPTIEPRLPPPRLSFLNMRSFGKTRREIFHWWGCLKTVKSGV